MSDKTIKLYTWPLIIAVVTLLLSFFPWPYSLYALLRVIITVVSIYYAYYLHKLNPEKKDYNFWIFVGVATLHNPFLPIHLYSRILWGTIDIGIIIFLINFYNKYVK